MAQRTQTKKKGSFRTNVIMTFLVISFVSLASTGVVSLWFVDLIGNSTRDESVNALENQIETNMNQTAHKTALVINQKLETAEGMIRAAAEELEAIFDDDSTYQPRAFYYDFHFENNSVAPWPPGTHYDAYYGLNVSWEYSSWYRSGTTSTNYLAYEVSEADKLGRVSNMDLLFNAIHDQVDFRWLYIAFFDDGLFINYPGSDLGGTDQDRTAYPYNPREEDWYRDIFSGQGDIVYVEPYYDEFDDVLLISIGKLVYHNGEPLAVISGDITIDDIKDKIINVKVLQSGYAFLLVESGNVVAHPEVGTEEYVHGLPPLLSVEVNPDNSSALTQDDVNNITEVSIFGTLQYTRNAADWILVFTPVGKGGYICVISVPLSEVLEAIPPLEERIAQANADARSFITLVTIVGIILAGVVAVAISNTITRPLQYMMDLATRNVSAMIREESLDTTELQVDEMYIAKDDEIGELARAFQGMLDTIREEE
jgi:HAMP domain-containing protein